MTRYTAVYERVSSASQDTRSQHAELEQWVQAYAKDSVEWFKDKLSGKSMNRPDWKRLEADIDAGKVEKVVVWRLDRLGRTASGLTALFEKLTTLGVGLVSVKDGLDLTTPAGRLIANVLASVAAYETEVRGERQMAGITQVRKRNNGKCTWGGQHEGRPPIARKVLEKLPTIVKLHRANLTQEEIAASTNVSRPVVSKWLSYLGDEFETPEDGVKHLQHLDREFRKARKK